ncbi:hypothetical protein ASZ90_001921 [hydrocarbon metagenome]|uniref:Uncharacterized protein n=1 Tax=hydrocarbon metagenome TaxID=938273 RepID=A0A0W8G585_9ZZZZ
MFSHGTGRSQSGWLHGVSGRDGKTVRPCPGCAPEKDAASSRAVGPVHGPG